MEGFKSSTKNIRRFALIFILNIDHTVDILTFEKIFLNKIP